MPSEVVAQYPELLEQYPHLREKYPELAGPPAATDAPGDKLTPAKAPWEMTRWEYIEESIEGENKRLKDRPEYQKPRTENVPHYQRLYDAAVRQAVERGKPVPRHILEQFAGQPWADAALSDKVSPPAPDLKSMTKAERKAYMVAKLMGEEPSPPGKKRGPRKGGRKRPSGQKKSLKKKPAADRLDDLLSNEQYSLQPKKAAPTRNKKVAKVVAEVLTDLYDVALETDAALTFDGAVKFFRERYGDERTRRLTPYIGEAWGRLQAMDSDVGPAGDVAAILQQSTIPEEPTRSESHEEDTPETPADSELPPVAGGGHPDHRLPSSPPGQRSGDDSGGEVGVGRPGTGQGPRADQPSAEELARRAARARLHGGDAGRRGVQRNPVAPLSDGTKRLIYRGLKFRISKEVLDSQIEDIDKLLVSPVSYYTQLAYCREQQFHDAKCHA